MLQRHSDERPGFRFFTEGDTTQWSMFSNKPTLRIPINQPGLHVTIVGEMLQLKSKSWTETRKYGWPGSCVHAYTVSALGVNVVLYWDLIRDMKGQGTT